MTQEQLEDHAFYESGLSADGCLEKLDDYTRKAIEKYGRILLEKQKQDFIDGFEGCCYCCEPVGLLNQKLERERDEANRLVCDTYDALTLNGCDLPSGIYSLPNRVRELERERDEAREDATNYYAKIGELTEERDKAQKLADQYKEMLDQLADPLLEKVDEAVQFRIKEIKEERDEAREELRNVHNLYCKKCDEILKLTFENRRLSQERDQYKEMFDMQTKIVVDLEMRLIKMEEQLKP